MTKKLIIIMFLIVFILAQFSICYADNEFSLVYNVSNVNLSSVNFSQNIVPRDISDLETNHFSNVFSRYSSPKCHISIEFTNLSITYIYSTSAYNSSSYSAFSNYVNNYTHNYIWGNVENLDTSQFNATFSPSNLGSNGYGVECNFRGILEFDTIFNIYALNSVPMASNENYEYCGFDVNMLNTYFTSGGYTFKNTWSYVSNANVSDTIVKYSFDRVISNIDGFIVGCFTYVYVSDEVFTGYQYNTSNNVSYTIGNVSNSLTTGNGGLNVGNILSCCIKCNMFDDSKINYISFSTHKNSMNGNYSYTFTSSHTINLIFAVYCPLFYSDKDYMIQSSENNTDTPLKLEYYDAEWYEIHKQLANGFIFIITELPIVSDVTNVIFTIVNLIYTGIDTLTQFSGFGILFTFGMFAVILGIFFKIIMNGD